MKSINPATGDLIGEYHPHDLKTVETMIHKGDQAFAKWKLTSFSERQNLMRKAAQILRDKAHTYGELIHQEMGKKLSDATAEVEKCAHCCDYYAEHAQSFLSPETIQTDYTLSQVTFAPLGLVLAVMPWNFPFWQVFRFAAPALMAGNTGILKHASNVSGCALAIEEVFTLAGFPEGVFQSVLLPGKEVERVIQHPLVKAVTLTGSTEAGKSVAKAAGENLKKSVLELGGSDAYVILEDADLDLAAKICAQSRLLNSGQSCISAKRFVVVEKVAAEFTKKLKEQMQSIELSPLARTDLRDDLHAQVQKSLQLGARCELGGEIPQGKGAYYPATILTNVTKGMPAYSEELFGPVASVIVARDEDQAFEIANDSVFGLGGAIFSRDTERAQKLAEQKMESGNCFINDLVKSDPRLPFGGIKQSGYGRELSHYGIKEFVNIKTICVK